LFILILEKNSFSSRVFYFSPNIAIVFFSWWPLVEGVSQAAALLLPLKISRLGQTRCHPFLMVLYFIATPQDLVMARPSVSTWPIAVGF
jgi:hypothetical protein